MKRAFAALAVLMLACSAEALAQTGATPGPAPARQGKFGKYLGGEQPAPPPPAAESAPVPAVVQPAPSRQRTAQPAAVPAPQPAANSPNAVRDGRGGDGPRGNETGQTARNPNGGGAPPQASPNRDRRFDNGNRDRDDRERRELAQRDRDRGGFDNRRDFERDRYRGDQSRSFNYRGRDYAVRRMEPFRYPPGWGYRPWHRGERMPRIFIGTNYFFDYAWMGLPPPPRGTRWVRYDSDAVLVDTFDGRIIDVIYDVFY